MTDVLRRCMFDQPVQLRAAPEGSTSPGTLFGYALQFNKLSRDLGGYYEEIAPEAVDLASTGRVMCRHEHRSSALLGTTDAGTLRLSKDDIGVLYEDDLPATSAGKDVAILAGRGDIAYSSFAFRVPPGGERWYIDAEDRLIVRVLALSLVDVAPVADPAYWSSSSEVRSMQLDLDKIRAGIATPPPTDPPAGARLRAELALAHAYGDRI